jgi:long-chain acyl-CoA synthetase
MSAAGSDFREQIFSSPERAGGSVVLEELRSGEPLAVTGEELLAQIGRARGFLRAAGLMRGQRCVLLAANSAAWAAVNLAIMAEGGIGVPLYARQAAVELAAMIRDCTPALIVCGDESLRSALRQQWPEAPPTVLLSEAITAAHPPVMEAPVPLGVNDPVTIIYTSGTSGVSKGVVLTAGNVTHMLTCTSGRLDQLMGGSGGQDRVFHYLPFCFAGSWILLLTCLLRGSRLALNTDLNRIAADLRAAAPDYFLNVPALLERMRRAVDEQLWQTGGVAQAVYQRAKNAWMRGRDHQVTGKDGFWLWLAEWLVFPAIRKKMIGTNLKALICGSAPLALETQLYYQMLGIKVLQVYGLTETTAICTMDDPQHVEPGRVGPAIPGVEMKLGADDEILVRGPNIFSSYWQRPEETAQVLREGWFATGDQGEVDGTGNWKIIGRTKNLIVLSSGHKVPPEPIEHTIAQTLAGSPQVVLVGNGRGYLAALITGGMTGENVLLALEAVNAQLPHYKQVRAFHVCPEAFSIENGLLTANGKLKRDAIAARWRDEIEGMYRARVSVAS